MGLDNNQQAFFELVKGGLWETEVRLASLGKLDYSEIYSLAEEQSVIGLVAAGIEHVTDSKIPQDIALTFVGSALQLEQRNAAMNVFIASLIKKLRDKDIYTLLVKGQGIAQCYERPLWRACGDVDLLLSNDNYEKAKSFLTGIASSVDEEDTKRKHLAMSIDSWIVELHGSLHCGWSKRVDMGIDDVIDDCFHFGNVRSWQNSGTLIFLPSPNNDVLFVFSHILQHFFVEGIGLRQICDWCRLLWTYRDEQDLKFLENRIRNMGVMTEWKAFGAMVVDYLGMPEEAMPFYDNSEKWKKKAQRIISLILDTGTFGHNRDLSYKQSDPFLKRLFRSFKRRNGDSFQQIVLFPLDGLRMWCKMIMLGMKVSVRGENVSANFNKN